MATGFVPFVVRASIEALRFATVTFAAIEVSEPPDSSEVPSC